jgi:4-hydroxy-tetrahydrodipicolinate synthase
MGSVSVLRLEGILPAFPTPTTPDGAVDVPALRALVEHLLKHGASGLVPVGGTGEFTALPPAARLTVVRETVAAARGRVPVLPGVLCPGFGEALEAGLAFRQAGADALMLLTPFYAKPSQAGIRDYFKAYHAQVTLPLLLYDIPTRTGVTAEPTTVLAMVDDGSIVGMKACNPDVIHFNHVAALVADRMAILSGEDTHFPLHMAMGARGGVLATASLVPALWVEMYRLATAGRIVEAVAAQRRLLPLIDAIFAETNPGPLKAAMNMAGLAVGAPLAPLRSPDAALMTRLRAVMEDLQLLEAPRARSAPVG